MTKQQLLSWYLSILLTMGFGGGTPSPNSITAAMIQAGVVSTAKLNSDVYHYRRWLTGVRNLAQTAAVNAVAGRAFLHAFEVTRKTTIDKFYMNCPTTNGNFRVGIYNDNGDTPAGGSLVIDSGSLVVGADNLLSLVQQLNQGLYWATVMFDGAVAQYVRATSIDVLPQPFDGAYYDRGGGYGAFTDPCPAITQDNTTCFVYGLRVASVNA